MTTASNPTAGEQQRKPRLNGWSPNALKKALMHELLSKAATLAPEVYPDFLPGLAAMTNRTRPVRLSKCGRHLRAWGRDYEFTEEEALIVKRVVKGYRDGVRKVTWPGSVLAAHQACKDGIIQFSDCCYWLQEPEDELNKPVQVLFTGDSDPYAGIEKEVLALAWLTQYPEWTDEQIALKCDIARTSIYRFERFKAARAVQKEGRQAYKEWQQTERGGKESTKSYERRRREELAED